MTIPEPADGRRVVTAVPNPAFGDPLRLWWRDDADAKRWGAHPDEHWFDNANSDPLAWTEVCRGAQVHLVDADPWKPLTQPDDPNEVAVRLVVERVVRDVVFDRAEFEEAKTENEIANYIDVDVSNMDGTPVVIEADGTEHRPF